MAWGGHFASGYDERKLAEVGLDLRCSWDSLYGFHLCFADFGTPRDEESEQDGKGKGNSQASGYDLGFVSSVLTPYPYHKGVVTHEKDALTVPSPELYEYCAGDVARAYWSWLAIEREAASEANMDQWYKLLDSELECARRAQRMSFRGVPIQDKLRKERLKGVKQERTEMEATARLCTDTPDFNLNSGKQVADALRRMGIKVRMNRATENPMLDGNEIEKLLAKYPDNPLLQIINRYRGLGTEITAYTNMAPAQDGRAHPSWKVHGTVGSRWSSSPNFQNITKALRDIIG